MNKILTILTTLALTTICIADDTVMVNDNGVLTYPQRSAFIEKNNIVSNEVVCLRVDMLGGDKWTDAELKVLSPEGRLLYFATTMYNDVIMWHCPSDKAESTTKNIDNTWDSKCKIYYYVAGNHHNDWYGQCSNPKQSHSVDALNRSPICDKESARITAIEFYPDMANEAIREIILNPENTIIISRKTPDYFEKDEEYNRIWRPTIPQYYRKK